jgi:hypothetical protein
LKSVAVPCVATVVHVAGHSGRRIVSSLDEAAGQRYEDAAPVRAIPAYRGQRSLPGWWWSATTGGHVVFESWVERHHIMEFDRTPAVIGLSGQPFAPVWTEGSRRRSHVPNPFARYADGRAVVIDCRPANRADEEFYRVAAITAGVCERIGWDYLLAGEPEPVRAANLPPVACSGSSAFQVTCVNRHCRCRRITLLTSSSDSSSLPLGSYRNSTVSVPVPSMARKKDQ